MRDRVRHAVLWVGAVLIRAIVHAFGATWRIRPARGDRRLRELLAADQPVVICFWHECSFFFAYYLSRELIRRGYRVTAFSSRSRDGELGAKLARLWGADVVRKAVTPSGSEGIRALYRAVKQRSSAPLVIPDGPAGPAHQAKVGAVVLAQMAEIPIQPVAFAARHCWHLTSWDRMMVPALFTRVDVAIGEPLHVPRQLPPEDLERERRRLERTLTGLAEGPRARH